MSRGRKPKKPEGWVEYPASSMDPGVELPSGDPGDETPEPESQEVDLSKVPSRYHKFYNKGA